jgi:hypothetical protein
MVTPRQSGLLRPLRVTLLMLLFVSASAALSAGCGRSGGGSGGGGSGGGGGEGGSGGSDGAGECFNYSTFKGDTPVISFQMEVLPIFRRSCGVSSSCHGATNSATPAQHYLGPSLTSPTPDATTITKILDGIVGVASVEEKTMKVIEAGSPQTSFMMYKLDGVKCEQLTCLDDEKCGVLMPQGSKMTMDSKERDIIRRWIAQGAKNN